MGRLTVVGLLVWVMAVMILNLNSRGSTEQKRPSPYVEDNGWYLTHSKYSIGTAARPRTFTSG